MNRFLCVLSVLWLGLATGVMGAELAVNETPAGDSEWGFRPRMEEKVSRNPPPFCWRPQEGAVAYELQVARSSNFEEIGYQTEVVGYNVHTPPVTLEEGAWWWRFRYTNKGGQSSPWSSVRRFEVPADAVVYPIPEQDELLARIPTEHPRMFMRPDDVERLREMARGELKGAYDALIERCDKYLADPPSTKEPPLYPKGTVRLSEEWLKYWRKSQIQTKDVLHPAVDLAFAYLLSGEEKYGQEARRLIMATMHWDPKGATGYLYNDEAGMPYVYLVSRAYSFAHDQFSDIDREIIRRVIRVRGQEMYHHLYPRHLWQPYSSHSNRAWHFLGEAAVAFHGEIEEADEWMWFAMNVFANLYPVWNDEDGGWHEGLAYWLSYMTRFTWWGDIMKASVGIDAYKLPFFSQVGDYAMYMLPPGQKGGGFGDQTSYRTSASTMPLMSVFASQANNPYWQWYVEANGGPPEPAGYLGFVRALYPSGEAKAPTDLPTAKCFRGIGQAMMNSTLLDAKDNVSVIFKSSPFFGTWSHGYESNNSFLLYAFGERLFIHSGRRDIYGSPHHKNWMWDTKSVNNITVNGQGQLKHSLASRGEILDFHTSPSFNYVVGEAGEAYEGRLNRFTRSILMVKPELVVIFDRLQAPEPSTYEWRLHAPTEMEIRNQSDVRVKNGEAACRVSFLAPQGLKMSQHDKFDPPLPDRIQLTEYHLMAETPSRSDAMTFVTAMSVHRDSEPLPAEVAFEEVAGGYVLDAPLKEGRRAVVLLRSAEGGEIRGGGLTADAEVAVALFDAEGQVVETFASGGGQVKVDAAQAMVTSFR